ncbi:RNA polymerase-binding protein DksA [Candidatus Riesia pediculischaeffi]|uniref:Molecular chaperone DnaK n=2 Tax=Candidatus Riesia pediculischaeffi TaxID=428411 RepID=A0A1V0HKV7_9ENTR|nr:RNA polymerase-binding protein DksA [Candidatus Riesia pediculischaeffi]ARC53372.1 molecular chaperone DnaK [Candidatus Riesia pediculischaeffi]KIE63863.1 C4-type zinc finger protein, DksA/TraR family [Candidatus Riesia pediculischaeffi PTSU]
MDEKKLNHFQKILEDWKKKLNRKRDLKSISIQSISENFPDPIDRAVQEEEFNFELRNRDRERRLIEKIDHTLYKIQLKKFGYCISCKVEIDLRRLEANPIADLCIECKTVDEIKKKQIKNS